MNISINTLHRFLFFNCIFCILLWLLRVCVTGSLFYGFLLWNLFLALLPFLISHTFSKTIWLKKQSFVIIIVLSVWLLFLPNAPYLITDLMHLRHAKSSLSWLDPFMLFFFAWNGLLFGLLSMYQVFEILSAKWNRVVAKRLLFVAVFLCGFGIYLGRYLRWNSWELFSDPMILLRDSFQSVVNPDSRMRTLGITFGFGVFLWLLFLTTLSFFSIKKASRN